MGNKSNVLNGVCTLYVKFPHGTASWRDIGYTEDGVNFEYSVTKNDIRVEEQTYPIRQSIDTESCKITANLAEFTLANLHIAAAGSTLAGARLSFGGGVDKEMQVKIVGENENGYDRTVVFPLCVASGSVATSWKRNEKNVLPIELTALKGTDIEICYWEDSTS